MEQEEKLRQEAIRLHLEGKSVHSISEALNRTRQWFYKWLRKYEQSSASDRYKSSSCKPKTFPNRTDKSLEQAVIEIRNRLSSQPYAQKGAINILYEFERLKVKPPSIIHAELGCSCKLRFPTVSVRFSYLLPNLGATVSSRNLTTMYRSIFMIIKYLHRLIT
jgi:transposase-like protein